MGTVSKRNPVSNNPTAAEAEALEDVRKRFERLRENRWKVVQSSADERIAKLRRLRDAVLARNEEIQRAIYEDFRKDPGEVDLTEIFTVVSELNHTMKHLKQWMKPTRVGTPLAMFGTHSEVRYEPRGVVLVLAPWNYPFQLLMNPVIAAIAAGNCVAVRPSSKVPATSRFLAGLLRELFTEDEVAVFEGDHAVSDALLEMPFDHFFFTGSPAIGKKVMAAAARHLASVTLELGGKSPVILDETADINKAAERILWGKFVNAGQTCVAPDYLLLHESRLHAFLDAAKKVVAARYGDTEEARKACPSFCRLVSDAHHRGLVKILDAAVKAGAKIELGGVSGDGERYLSPTLLSGITEDSPIMKEEIFGPILPILTYSDLDEALRIVRSKEKPLALYVFSEDSNTIDRVLKGTTAGGSCVNTVMLHVGNPNLPFGGVGQSGLGHYHGVYGFRSLSHERAVLTQGWIDSLRMFYPPYNEKVRKMIRLAVRRLS